jgi:hypothetical protein
MEQTIGNIDTNGIANPRLAAVALQPPTLSKETRLSDMLGCCGRAAQPIGRPARGAGHHCCETMFPSQVEDATRPSGPLLSRPRLRLACQWVFKTRKRILRGGVALCLGYMSRGCCSMVLCRRCVSGEGDSGDRHPAAAESCGPSFNTGRKGSQGLLKFQDPGRR